MRVFPSWEIASKENKFAGRNTTRWRNEEFDRLYKSAETEMDPVKRAAVLIRMNDLVVQNIVVIPLVWRNWSRASPEQAEGHRDQRLGLELLEPGALVPGGVIAAGLEGRS